MRHRDVKSPARNLFRWRRLQLGLPQLQLSDLSGVGQVTISKIEREHFSSVSDKAVQMLALYLGINAPEKKGDNSKSKADSSV